MTDVAIATPGDIVLHIRSDRRDLCVELERQLLGFVEGTANPVGRALPESALVGDEDERVAGGTYVVVQRYVHPLAAWWALTTEQQEAIMGRTKADNIELDDAADGQKCHKTLGTIEDGAGEHDILRDNMPFASPGSGEFGTYSSAAPDTSG